MDIWEDTFGEGSRFRRVYWLAPVISVAVMSLWLGARWSDFGLVLVSFLAGVGFMGLNYILAEKPALFAWFVTFRAARSLGLNRRAAGAFAAPCMALAASIPALAMLLLFTTLPLGLSFAVSQLSLHDVAKFAGFVACSSMVVSFMLACWGPEAKHDGRPPTSIRRFELRRMGSVEPDRDDRVRRA